MTTNQKDKEDDQLLMITVATIIFSSMILIVCAAQYRNLLLYFSYKDGHTVLTNFTFFIVILLAVTVAIIISLILFLIPKWREHIKRHIELSTLLNLINIAFVIVAVWLTFSMYYIDQARGYIETRWALESAHRMNYNIALDFANYRDKKWVYWQQFQTDLLETNLGFVARNMPQNDCISRHLSLISKMDTANAMTGQFSSLEEIKVNGYTNLLSYILLEGEAILIKCFDVDEATLKEETNKTLYSEEES